MSNKQLYIVLVYLSTRKVDKVNKRKKIIKIREK